MYKKKRGSMELSVSAIVVLILAITMLSLGLVFVKGMLGKMFNKFEEQISEEPEPPKPTLSQPITMSRNPVITTEGTAEVVKISILNPSQQDWINRQFIRTEKMCGKVDGICYIDVDDTTGTCDTESNAKSNDPDCNKRECDKAGKKYPCLISNLPDLYCPYLTEENRADNCVPKEGVDIYVSCDKRLMKEPFKRNIGPINTGYDKTNILILRINSKVREDQYLCQLKVFAEDKEYMKDLIVKIEKE